ncbi:hypothetical protein ACVIF9_010026 [Bradyrhizobium sp. USDA 4350]
MAALLSTRICHCADAALLTKTVECMAIDPKCAKRAAAQSRPS